MRVFWGLILFLVLSLNQLSSAQSLRRIKEFFLPRLSREELLQPGATYLAVVRGEEPYSQEVKYLPTPEVGAEEVLIVPLLSGVTGSDVDIYTGARPAPAGVMGHEVVAQVIRVGREVEGIKPGDVVTINPNNPEDPDDIIGFNGDGFFARSYKIPARFVRHREENIFDVPYQLPFFNTLFAEMLATVNFAQDVIREQIREKNVVVVGAGPAGILHTLLARHLGAKRVILLEKDPARYQRAIEKEFVEPENAILVDETTPQKVLELTEGRGADVVIIATSEFRTVQWALDYLAETAIVNLYGKIKEGSKLVFKDGTVFDAYQFYKARKPGQPQIRTIQADGKKIKFVLTRGERAEDFVEALNLLEQGIIDPYGIITHVVSLEGLPDVLKQLSQGYRLNGEAVHKVIVDSRLQGKQILKIEDYLNAFGKGRRKLIQLETLAEQSWSLGTSIDLFGFSEERLAKAVVSNIIWEYQRARAEGKKFVLFLPGGSSLKSLALFRKPEYYGLIDWSQVEIFFGDERMGIRMDDERSNARQAFDIFLDYLIKEGILPAENVHRINTENELAQEARRYEQEVQEALKDNPRTFALLGMGPDGHISSIFSDFPWQEEGERLFLDVSGRTQPNQLDRITSTPYFLNNYIDNIMLVVSGEGKAQILAEVYRDLSQRNYQSLYPAVKVFLNQKKEVLIFADPLAISGLLEKPAY